jgi:hypothetical protein
MVGMCYGGRYIILLNGIFGAYVGFLYNEAFAFPMNWFGGSRWHLAEDPWVGCAAHPDPAALPPVCSMDSPYPVGIDPIWHYTANKITFFNSFKMKISIIVGVIQMTVGICLSLLNHIEYGDYKRIFFEYLPEMIFFEGIFGYLVFTIFYKWNTDWETRCLRVIDEFNRDAVLLFDDTARENGGIHGEDRHGVMRFFPFTTLSIGALRVKPGKYKSAEAVANDAAHAKHMAKLGGQGLAIE